MNFLTISRNLLMALQFVSVTGLLFSTFFMIASPQSITTYNWGGLLLVPENTNILKESGEVMIAFKPDPSINTKLIVTETSIQMDGIIPELRVSFIILFIIIGIIWIIVVEQIRKMVESVADRNPFTHWNVRRIYTLAIASAAVPVIGTGFHFLNKAWIQTNFDFSGLVLQDFSLNISPWFLTAVLLFTIGKIIESGIEIKQDQDLTI